MVRLGKELLDGASTPMVFSYHSTLALCAERCSLFCIAIARYCGFTLLSFFMSALIGDQV